MRSLFTAAGLAVLLGFTAASPATAYTRYGPGPGGDVSSSDGPGSGIGAWRRYYDRQQYQQYRGHPGAQYELRMKRRNLCRNTPEMC